MKTTKNFDLAVNKNVASAVAESIGQASAYRDLVDDEYEGVIDVLHRWHAIANQYLYWYMDLLAREWVMPRVFYYFIWAVSTLQLFSYAADATLSFQWSTSITRVAMSICRAVAQFPPTASALAPYKAACALALGIPAACAAGAVTVHRLGWTKPLRWTRTLLMFSQLLLIPVANHLLRMTFGCIRVAHGSPNVYYLEQECGTPGFYALATFSVLFCLVFFVGMNVVGLTCYQSTIPAELNKRHPVTAQVLGSHTTFYVWSIFTLSLTQALSQTEGWRWPMSIVLMIAGGTLSYVEFVTLPRFADDAQILSSLQAAGVAWTGVCAFITTALNADADRGQATAMLLYAGFPLLAVITVMGHRARYNALAMLCDRDMQAPMDIVLRSRSILWHWNRQTHERGYDYYIEETEDVCRSRDGAFRALQETFELGVTRFPQSALIHLCMARVYTEILDNRVLAYGAIQAAEPHANSTSIKFALHRLRLRLDSITTDAQSKEVRSYLEFKTRKEDAETAMVAASRLLVDFWSELLAPEPDIDALSYLSHTARRLVARATDNYDRLLEINPGSVPVLRTYGTVVLDILGDAPRALDMFERAESLEIARTKATDNGEFLQRLTTSLDIFDDRNAVFGISVDKASLGIIESVNPAAKKLFGYFQSSDLVGKNISAIMPSPLAEMHNQIVSEYLIRKTSRIVNQTRVTYGLHRFGYLMPLNLYVRWADEAAGKMVGVIQTVDLQRDVHFLVDAASWTVRYATKNALDFFGIRRAQLADGGVLLPELLTDLQRRHVAAGAGEDAEAEADEAAADVARSWRQLGTHSGLIGHGRHYDTQRDFPVRAWSQTVSVAGADVVFVRVLVYEYTEEEDDAEEDEEAFLTQYQRTDGNKEAADDEEGVAVVPTLLAGLVGDDDDDNILVGRVVPPRVGTIPPANSLRMIVPTPSASPALPMRVPPALVAAPSMRSILKPSASQRVLDVGAAAGAEMPSAGTIVDVAAPSPASLAASTRTAVRLTQAKRAAQRLERSLSSNSTSALLGASARGGSSSTPVPLETPDAGVQKRRNAAPSRAASAMQLNAAETGFSSSAPPPSRSGVRSIVVGSEVDTRSRSSAGTSDVLGLKDKRTRAFRQKRLLRAIEVENEQTARGIARMSLISHLLVYLVILLAVVAYTISTTALDASTENSKYVLASSNRNVMLMDAVVSLRTLTLSNSLNYLALYDMPGPMPTSFEEAYTATATRMMVGTGLIEKATAFLDQVPIVSTAHNFLRNSQSVAYTLRLGDGVVTNFMGSLREGFMRLSASMHRVRMIALETLTLQSTSQLSFFCITNGLEALRLASDQNTLLKRIAMGREHSALLTKLIVIYVMAVAAMLVVLFLFIRPIVMRVERSKTRVLDMFLDIKRPVRRALRRQVYSVYVMMKSDGEEDTRGVEEEPTEGAAVAEAGDEGDRAAASGLANAAGADATAAEAKDGAAGKDNGSRGGTAHSRYLMRIARRRAARKHAVAYNQSDSSGDDASLDGKGGGSGRSRERAARSAIDAFLGSLDAAETASQESGEAKSPKPAATASATAADVDDGEMTDAKAAPLAPSKLGRQMSFVAATPVGENGEVTVNLSSFTTAAKAALVRSETQERLSLMSPAERARQNEANSAAALVEVHSTSRKSLLARSALRSLFLRFSLFVGLVIGYSVMMCVLTDNATKFVDDFSARIDTSTRRVSMLQRAYFNARESLFGRYSDIMKANPMAPTLRGGDFIIMGRQYLNETIRLHHAIQFGDEEMGLGLPVKFSEQERLYSETACDLPYGDRADGLMIGSVSTFPHYNTNCKTFAGGVLDRGLTQGLLHAFNTLDGLLVMENEGLFGMWHGYPANTFKPMGSAAYEVASSQFFEISAFINYYLALGFWRSSAVYLVQTLESIESFNSLRLILMICFCVLLFFVYLFGIRPVGHQLDVAARQTRAMMLILPPDVVKSIPSVQAFIVDNLRKRV